MKKFEQLNQQEKEINRQKLKKDNSTITITPKMILVCLLVLLVIGAGLFFLFRDTSSNKPTANDILAANAFSGNQNQTNSNGSTILDGPTINPEYGNAVTAATRLLKSRPMSYNVLINQLVEKGYSTEAATYGADHCEVDWNAIAVRRAKALLDESPCDDEELRNKMADEQFSSELIDYALSNSSVKDKIKASQATHTPGQAEDISDLSEINNQQETIALATDSTEETTVLEEQTATPTPLATATPTPVITDSPTPEPEEQATKVPSEYENAVRSAERLIKSMPLSRETLIDKLSERGYRSEAVTYAADNSGIDWNEQALKRAQKLLKTKEYSNEELISQLEQEKFTHEEAVYAIDNCQ